MDAFASLTGGAPAGDNDEGEGLHSTEHAVSNQHNSETQNMLMEPLGDSFFDLNATTSLTRKEYDHPSYQHQGDVQQADFSFRQMQGLMHNPQLGPIDQSAQELNHHQGATVPDTNSTSLHQQFIQTQTQPQHTQLKQPHFPTTQNLSVPNSTQPLVQPSLEQQPSLQARRSLAASSPRRPLPTNQLIAGSATNSDPASTDVIELLDDDSERECSAASTKRQRIDGSTNVGAVPLAPASASFDARSTQMSTWMKRQGTQHQGNAVGIASTSSENRLIPTTEPKRADVAATPHRHDPTYFDIPKDFSPTWNNLLPAQVLRRPQGRRAFELSLLNVQEFTITGLPINHEGEPTPVAGLRKKIKDLARGHGKAVFERNKEEGGGRWKIPLGAYRSFYSYLCSDPLCQVVGIPESQLKIASLGKARLEKGYPSAEKLMSQGVPRGLATALAPFQRGGVDFVVEKEGRALIADDMGLGKTVQSIASMSVYHDEWPLLVLTPSSARYHWENEFQQWLGKNSSVNNEPSESANQPPKFESEAYLDKCMPLLEDSQIHVLTSGKDPIFPTESTRVVICSYGLAPMLVESGKVTSGMFKCAIVDESHMLKNISSKRTSKLVPVLHATNRCVLLSGTPAMARPAELWPQLKILGTERQGWWEDMDEFVAKYVKRTSAVRRAELHALLTGTVMIRRMKNDILKSLPSKLRLKAVVDVSTPAVRREFTQCMALLREGKGILGKLARQHTALGGLEEDIDGIRTQESSTLQSQVRDNESIRKMEEAKRKLRAEYDRRYHEGQSRIRYTLTTTVHQLNEVEQGNLVSQLDLDLRRELKVWYEERVHELDCEQPQLQSPELTRTSVLNRMYSLTARAKLPLIADMINKWLRDPTKGKLCVFAHHIFVLDELIALTGLLHEAGRDYIRIDGSTSPRDRQANVKRFQTDPSVRIAILGITAAGVAVTLTASATVWFAELFWTPALMIQAEDRCHRIGQNSRVQCMYFVAVGTLDELLWRLLEKKFRDLGEFVEGKEKQSIVIHKTFHGVEELYTQFGDADMDEGSDDLLLESDNENENSELLQLENDLEGDIANLGKEELTMIKSEMDEDEVIEDAKPAGAVLSNANKYGSAGRSEEEAICLSDDEGENGKSDAEAEGAKSPSDPADVQQTELAGSAFNIQKPMANCRAYTILFDGPSFGIELFSFHGRAVVAKQHDSRCEKPGVGDVLVAANGQRIPKVQRIQQVTQYLKTLISQSSVELTFLENEGLVNHLLHKWDTERKQAEQWMKMSKSATGPAAVVDLLDDD